MLPRSLPTTPSLFSAPHERDRVNRGLSGTPLRRVLDDPFVSIRSTLCATSSSFDSSALRTLASAHERRVPTDSASNDAFITALIAAPNTPPSQSRRSLPAPSPCLPTFSSHAVT
jgi:hypothetical protein